MYGERILAPETTDDFLWIVIVGAFGALFAAFSIGPNGVANAFATSVGAKALTIKQAVVLAGVFEFLGAVLLARTLPRPSARVSPIGRLYVVYSAGVVESDSELGNGAFWILAIGGVGIVMGLALYGYKIIAAIGVKIAKITPSRGFAIELGSAIMVIIGTRIEIPLSTTHCQVGATIGVALLEGAGGINGVVLGKTVFGWIITIIVCALTCSLLFAQGAYAPYAYDTIDLVEETSS